MKRGTFKKPTLEEVRAKRATKSHIIPKVKSKTKRAQKLPSLKKEREKADSYLTPIAKKLHPYCECCGAPTQVGHHWIEKSRSSYLRYEMDNIVALCNPCHSKIHNRFGNSVVGGLDVALVIIGKRGMAWKEKLDKDQKIEVHVNREFYRENQVRLKNLLESL